MLQGNVVLDDLIDSSAICKPDAATDIETLTTLRTPKYEVFLDEWERGASVSFEGELESDERLLLQQVVYDSDGKCITLRTRHRTYELDVRSSPLVSAPPDFPLGRHILRERRTGTPSAVWSSQVAVTP
jgi:hypothetical protein